ncbi:MAG: cellulose biosynthesis protein BcsG [Gallionella sp.]|nr:cellulose biosynthesis protein BcsG [Gallionella sp.]
MISKDRGYKPELRHKSPVQNNDSANGRENSISPNKPVGPPIGNRRTRAEQRQDPIAHTSSMPATPSWANYLNKLGEQVLSENKGEHQKLNAPAEPQLSGNAQNDGGTNVRQRVNSISPDESASLPIGNRRTRAEQAHAPIVRAPTDAHETPYWSNYLNKLSKPLKPPHLTEPQPFEAEAQISSETETQQLTVHRELSYDGSENARRHGNSASSNEAAHIPIGDRRTQAEQRHDTSAQPVIHQTISSYWSSLLNGLLTLLKRPVASENLPSTGGYPVETDAAFHTKISLGIWGYYFAAKLTLFWMNLISFHPLENLALAVFILFSSARQRWRRIKNALIAVSALALLYYDSWLPPIGNVVSQASLLSDFKFSYLVELILRFISLSVIAVLLAVCLSYWILSYRLRVGALVLSCLAALYLFEYPVPNMVAEPVFKQDTTTYLPNSDINKAEQTFFDNEAQRVVALPIPQDDAVPFDVIFIQVCSLSWDDLRYVGLDQHPLLAVPQRCVLWLMVAYNPL